MNVKKEYMKFIERYPSVAREVITYEDGEGKSIKMKLRDGKTAWYFPLVDKNNATHTK